MTIEISEFFMFDGRNFEWDENKRSQNIKKHGVDFEDVKKIDRHSISTRPIYRGGELRYMTFALLNNRLHTLIWTKRYDIIVRIISFRKSKDKEITEYEKRI